jgi:hypothetical protein
VRYLRTFAKFWYDFIVGDDWRVAAGVLLALGACGALSRLGVPAWWVLPLATAIVLGTSMRRAAR